MEVGNSRPEMSILGCVTYMTAWSNPLDFWTRDNASNTAGDAELQHTTKYECFLHAIE